MPGRLLGLPIHVHLLAPVDSGQLISTELAAAILTSVLLGVLTLPDRTFRFWYAWASRMCIFAVALLLIGHVGAGVAGYAIAHWIHFRPADQPWLNGLAFGLLGQSLFRVQVGGDIDFHRSSAVAAPISLLRIYRHWVLGLVTGATGNAVDGCIRALDDEVVLKLALYIYGRYIDPDPKLGQAQKDLLLKQVVDGGDKLKIPAERMEGRGSLEAFCAEEMAKRELRLREPPGG